MSNDSRYRDADINAFRGRAPGRPYLLRPGLAQLDRCFRIQKGTWLDEDNPSDDNSTDSVLFARNDISGTVKKRIIVLDFEREITATKFLWLLADIQSVATSEDNFVFATGSNGYVDSTVNCTFKPVTSFNGLTVSTLNWGNQGTLDLGIAYDSLIARGFGAWDTQSGSGDDVEWQAQGLTDQSSIMFDLGTDRPTFLGAWLELTVSVNALGFNTDAMGEMAINRTGDTGPDAKMACFYNPD